MNFNDGSMVNPVEDTAGGAQGQFTHSSLLVFQDHKHGIFRSPLPKVALNRQHEDRHKKATTANGSNRAKEGKVNAAKDSSEPISSALRNSFNPTCDRGSLLYKYEKQVYLNKSTKAIQKCGGDDRRQLLPTPAAEKCNS